MKLALLTTAILCISVTASAAVITVPDDFSSIQDAIVAAAPQDTIIVRAGIYVENIDFLGKAITVRSESGPQFTIIDGGSPVNPDRGSVVSFMNGEDSASVLQGFTLTNGTGNKFSDSTFGGAVYCDDRTSPTIAGNIITGNQAGSDGAITCSRESSPLIEGNTITDNFAYRHGTGAIRVDIHATPLIRRNTISRNTSLVRYGGGIMSWYGSPQIVENVITDNVAQSSGGGIFCYEGTGVVIAGNEISGNRTIEGGGINCKWGVSGVIEGNRIFDNEATTGAGLYIHGYENAPLAIRNNAIYSNRATSKGGGATIWDHPEALDGNTFHGNTAGESGGAIFCYHTVEIVHSIFRSNDAPSGRQITVAVFPGSTSCLEVSYSDIPMGQGEIKLHQAATVKIGAGVFNADPLFVDPLSGDFRLKQDPVQPGITNRCVDGGDPAAPIPVGTTRTDGVQDGGVVDLGFHAPLPHVIGVPVDFPTIQSAIDAAVDGDTIAVGDGVYLENIDFHGKRITVRSENGPEAATIDGGSAGSVVTFVSGEDGASRLEGFTITNGSGQAYGYGGGIFCDRSSPTIAGNIIRENTSLSFGGGVGCIHASPILSGNTIAANGSGSGGGLFGIDSSPRIEDNLFVWNDSAVSGGGVHVEQGSPVLTGNEFRGNQSLYGGGIYIANGSPLIRDNLIRNNSVHGQGAGVSLWGVVGARFEGNVLSGNRAAEHRDASGGGLSCTSSTIVVSGCLAHGNSAIDTGGAFRFEQSDVTFTGNTVALNDAGDGGGLWLGRSNAVVTNSIIWGNLHAEISLRSNYGRVSTLTIAYSLSGKTVFIGSGCELHQDPGVISEDPLFAASTTGDFHLQAGSPCRDAGTASAPSITTVDMEGDPRVSGIAPDMGADEFHPHLYHRGSITPGQFVRVCVVGEPGGLVTHLVARQARHTPLPTPAGPFFLALPFVSGPAVPIPASGISNIPVSVPAGWVSGEIRFMQALSGNRLTNMMTIEVE